MQRSCVAYEAWPCQRHTNAIKWWRPCKHKARCFAQSNGAATSCSTTRSIGVVRVRPHPRDMIPLSDCGKPPVPKSYPPTRSTQVAQLRWRHTYHAFITTPWPGACPLSMPATLNACGHHLILMPHSTQSRASARAATKQHDDHVNKKKLAQRPCRQRTHDSMTQQLFAFKAVQQFRGSHTATCKHRRGSTLPAQLALTAVPWPQAW